MFVTFDPAVRVCLGVVTLGLPERLWGCLDALMSHESRHEFTVVCVVNAAAPDGPPPKAPFPAGVAVEHAGANLGWAGGLHRARGRTDAELFVWVQDDMVPEPGWLDALVDAADAHPRVGGFGSVRVDDGGAVLVHNAGSALPADAVERWNDTDRTEADLPAGVTAYDWVTSKGFLTRTAVFDEVGGPDPRLWPLNHVDKDYCTHLRAHGWEVALVPGARLRHTGSQSSPGAFRVFLGPWRDPWFNRRWAPTVRALAGRPAAGVDHPCAEWRSLSVDRAAAAAALEATRMVVPLARVQAAEVDRLSERIAALTAELDAAAAHAGDLADELAVAQAQRDRARRRARRLRRRLRRARGRLADLERSRSRGPSRRLRRLARRLR